MIFLNEMSVVRLLTVYNERDIIRENIEFYASQGIETVVLDNYSKDGTYEILKEFEGKGVRWIERYKTDFYDIRKLNTILINLAKKEKEEYFIWLDADEFLFFYRNFPLKFIIKFLFKKFKLIDAFNAAKVEFYHTDIKELNKENINCFKLEKLKYFYFERVWKDVIFRKKNNLKSYLDKPFYIDEKSNLPIKYKKLNYLFFIKHYPFRSIRQAKKKVFRAIPKNLKCDGVVDPKILNYHLISLKDNLENSIIRKKNNLYFFEEDEDFFKNFLVSNFKNLSKYFNKIETIMEEI